MRKLFYIAPAFLVIFTALILGIAACQKEQIPTTPSTIAEEKSTAALDRDGYTLKCGETINGSTSTQGTTNYTPYKIDLTGYSEYCKITIFYNAAEAPNRFEVRSANGTQMGLSGIPNSAGVVPFWGWVGATNCNPIPNGYPWSTFSNTNLNEVALGAFSFIKGSSDIFFLNVSGYVTNCGNPSGIGNDFWSVKMECACPPLPPVENTCHCGKLLQGSYSGVGYHQYPSIPIKLDCPDYGSNIEVTFNYNAATVPNRFIVKNASGVELGRSGLLFTSPVAGWVGQATWPGQPFWASSLNLPSLSAFTVTVSAADLPLSLEIEGYLPPNGEPTNFGTDVWEVTIGCRKIVNPTNECDLGIRYIKEDCPLSTYRFWAVGLPNSTQLPVNANVTWSVARSSGPNCEQISTTPIVFPTEGSQDLYLHQGGTNTPHDLPAGWYQICARVQYADGKVCTVCKCVYIEVCGGK